MDKWLTDVLVEASYLKVAALCKRVSDRSNWQAYIADAVVDKKIDNNYSELVRVRDRIRK